MSSRKLLLTRIGWLLIAGLSLACYAFSLPGKVQFFNWLLESDAGFGQSLSRLGISPAIYIGFEIAQVTLFALIYTLVGALIFWRKSGEPLAVYVSIMLVTFGTVTFTNTVPDLQQSASWLYVTAQILQYVGTVTIGWFAYLFPDGRFTPAWTRYTAGLWALWHAWIAVAYAIHYQPPAWLSPIETGLTIGFVVSWVAAQAIRYRSTTNMVQKQQTKWVMMGISVAVVGWLLATLLLRPVSGDIVPIEIRTTLQILFFLCIPLSIAFAIFRYRLWDIDILVNRTLVYATLSLLVVALYALIASGLGWLFRSEGNFYISLLATALIAILFQPLRENLQANVNRLLYGERDEPAVVLARLGQRLESSLAPEALLATVVETAAQALNVSYASIFLQDETDSPAAEYGHKPASFSPLHLPLTYQSESVGQLYIAPRAPGEDFTPADKKLLAMIAQQAGAAAYAVRLNRQLRVVNADLQHSREALVNAREEERRRLRRELHDGLGPTLASLLQRVDALRLNIAKDPQKAGQMAEELKKQVKGTVAEVRRMAYELRPPALDEFGLVDALREQLRQIQPEGGLRISLEAASEIPSLPAAVEVAVYRIALEAVTNVARHAQAQTCTVSIAHSAGRLILTVQDDGRGLPGDAKTGVGMISMRERAEELGGELEVKSNRGQGTILQTRFPLAGEN
ncbi:MAG: hypothetical protein HYZ25_16570 [Chloroflexi bacterium]|nr:hypothetical protein [Chloroflexota bacterium]